MSRTNGAQDTSHGLLWAGLEVRHLQALLAVADEGTFSRAAGRLGYTQSAVSQQVRALEQMVGATLFDRPGGPRPVSPTPEGEALVAHARAVLGRLNDAAAELRALAQGEHGTLRVGTIQSVGRQILPSLLRRFRVDHPQVTVQLSESADPAHLVDLLGEGLLDVAFVPLPFPQGPFDVEVLIDDPFVLLAPADSPEAACASVSIDEIVGLPLVGYRSSWCRDAAARQFVAAGHPPPTYLFQSDDNPTIQAFVRAGEAYAFTNLLSVDADDSRTTAVRIDPPVEPRRVALVQPADRRRPAALAPFVETAERVCADLVLAVT